MTKPRTPLAKAMLTGAAAKNPQRYRNRVAPSTGPIGDPPSFLSKAERAAWRSFMVSLPWLAQSDRAFLAAVCRLRVLIEGGEQTASHLREYRQSLSALGATPTSRANVHCSPPDGEDPFGRFDA